MTKHKQKRVGKKNIIIKIVITIFVLLSCVILIEAYHLYVVATKSVFLEIDDPMEVRRIVTSVFTIGETSRSQVEHELENGTLGLISCDERQYRTPLSEIILHCRVRASVSIIFPEMYSIMLGFNENILSEVEVVRYVKGAL